MKLTWIGHACFKLESEDGSIIFDPYKDNCVVGLNNIREKADLVLCSHSHDDHYGIENVQLSGKNTTFEIEKIHSYHDDQKGLLRGENTIHIVHTEGMRVVHLGDIGCDFNTDQIQYCDVLLIPIGGYYTIDTSFALKLINRIQPRIVIPMHYRSETFGYPVLSTADEFVSKANNVIRYDTSSIEITKDIKSQTAILKPKNC